jgi:hypothetical protein
VDANVIDAAPIIIDAGSPDGFPGCSADDDYGDVGPVDGTAISQMMSTSTSPDYIAFRGELTGATLGPDELLLELYRLPGGPFADGITEGSYQLDGVNAQYATCYVCVLVDTDVEGTPLHRYLATTGTVDVTSVEPNITATISNVTLRHVTIDPATFQSTPASPCTSAIAAGEVDALIVAQP